MKNNILNSGDNSGPAQTPWVYNIYHIIFWLVYYSFWILVYQDSYKIFSQLLLITAVFTISHASIYYFSQYILIPRFQRSKWMIVFVPAYLGTAVLGTVFMYLCISWVYNQDLESAIPASTFQILLYYFTSNLFTPAILLAIKGFMDSRKNLRQNELKEKERLESELNFLRSQVNPHFLFNAINSVYVLIKIDPEKAADTLIKLSNLLRSQLYEFSSDKIEIQQELEYLENYIELEKIRKGQRLSMTWEKGDGLENFSISPLILIPFLENCFKHLSSFTKNPNEIMVKIERENGFLSAWFYNTTDFKVRDNKEVMGGIGLKNIKRRLALLYPKRHSLEIKELEHAFEVTLRIKLDLYEN